MPYSKPLFLMSIRTSRHEQWPIEKVMSLSSGTSPRSRKVAKPWPPRVPKPTLKRMAGKWKHSASAGGSESAAGTAGQSSMQDAPSRKHQCMHQTSRSSHHFSVALSHCSSFTAGSYSSPIHARSLLIIPVIWQTLSLMTWRYLAVMTKLSSIVMQGNGDDVSSEDEHKDGDKLKPVKKECAQDILTIFSDLYKVKFCNSNGAVEVLTGRWCNVCKWAKCQFTIVDLYSQYGKGMTRCSSRNMGNARCFTLVPTRHVNNTSVGTMACTRSDVRSRTWRCITMWYHGRFWGKEQS